MDGAAGAAGRDRPTLDRPTLDWLAGNGLPEARLARVAALHGGFRNDNLLLVTRSGQRLVLRRCLHRRSAAVEVALAARLAGVVPVAEVVAADVDGAATGVPLVLSRFLPGDPVDRLLAGPARGDAAALGSATGGALAALGTVTFPGPGFFAGADLVPASATGGVPASLGGFVEHCLRAGGDRLLTPAEADGLRVLAARWEPLVATVADARSLVHADYNPKNLLAAPATAGWTVTGVLDWEFAFSGSPLVDIGNLRRFPDDSPPPFAGGAVEGFRRGGGDLPEGWEAVSRALDLFSVADLLTRPPGSPFAGRAAALVRGYLTRY